jgi:hypothetical protein
MSRQAVYARIALHFAVVNADLAAFCDAEAAVYSLPDPAERRAIVAEFNEVFGA